MDIEKRAEELAEYYFALGGDRHKSLSLSVARLIREAVEEATRELEARLRDYEQRYGELGREGA